MVKRGKRKVWDGDKQRVSWRQGAKGFAKDWDGDPTTKTYNKAGLKKQPKHSPHTGSRRPKHKPHMGGKPDQGDS